MARGKLTSHRFDSTNVTRVEFNKLVAQFEALLVKLDADSVLDDDDYVSELGGVARPVSVV